MGIFDAVFNPQAMASQGGLLGGLSREDLLKFLGQPQQQAQPQMPMLPQTGPTFAQGNNGSMGGVPFPIFGQAPQQEQTAIPQNAQPTQYQAPQQQIPTALQSPVGGNLGAGFLGFMNASSPMQAIGNLVQGLATGQRTDPSGMQQQSAQATYQALRQAGVPDGVAQAAALNPEVLKTIAPQIYTKPKYQVVSETPLGKDYGFVDEGRQTINGQPFQGGTSGTGSISNSLLAPNVKKMDSTLSGEDYLNQFSPEVKAAVKAYINGDVMPTGNPRLQGISTFAKTVAQKYGADTGTPISDALYSQRRMYRSQLGSNTPNSAGGQAKAFNQGIEHMDALADTLLKLDNSNGLGIPLLADAVNTGRQALSTEQSAISDKAKGIGQTLAGEVGKLFSGTAGGGVHERALTMERFSTVKSPQQLAAALEATLEVMKGGLTALEQRRDEVLGPNSDVRFVNKETEQKMAHIQQVIDKLKGVAPKQAEQPQQKSAPKIDEVVDGYRFRGGDPASPQNWQKVK